MTMAAHQVLKRVRRELRLILRILRADLLQHEKWEAERLRLKREWEEAGRVGPPPHAVKESAIRTLAHAHGIRTVVETGTLHGDMVAALALDFDHVYSIELSRELYWLARLRFLGRRNVHLVLGDSAEKLPSVLTHVDAPCIFWLDGHYGGGFMARGKKDVPIVEELAAILAHPVHDHTIVIDDVGLFERAEGETPSLEDLEAQIRSSRPASEFVVADNMIHVTLVD
jgi:hypothetical protein